MPETLFTMQQLESSSPEEVGRRLGSCLEELGEPEVEEQSTLVGQSHCWVAEFHRVSPARWVWLWLASFSRLWSGV